IAYGGPVTVTDPDVTRYFMTTPEACQLILQAGALGEGREIFILKMGTPVKIAQMARDLISLSGKEPGKDIEIIYTGLRPGEKLYEELITEGEGIVQTSHKKIMVLRPDGNWNGHGDREAFRSWLMKGIGELQEAAMRHDGPGIRTKLRELVPEYQPGGDVRTEDRGRRTEDGGQGIRGRIRRLRRLHRLKERKREKTDDGGRRTEGTPVEHPKETRFNWARRTESTRLEREKVRK
ncbi:MAG: polysaccharide biosynthesis protein, partial [Deltaproteobacteria bacterium]|nr:polysaccharide biosynthesis protein [Deltaproteobacteria bacterium]